MPVKCFLALGQKRTVTLHISVSSLPISSEERQGCQELLCLPESSLASTEIAEESSSALLHRNSKSQGENRMNIGLSANSCGVQKRLSKLPILRIISQGRTAPSQLNPHCSK